MKQNFHSAALLLFFALLISFSLISASRKLAPKQGEADLKMSKDSVLKMQTTDSFNELVGLELEKCEINEDEEECLKRRVIAEAHLDYIYTQQHKP